MVKHLLGGIDDHLTLLRKDVFEIAELTTAIKPLSGDCLLQLAGE